MTSAPSGVDLVSAPKDYDELFRKYYPFVVNLVGKHGITDNNKEDVASEILARFFERGFLDVYNPDLTFEFAGEARPARFKTFLSKFVLKYVRGHLDKQKRLQLREWQIVDLAIGEAVHAPGGAGASRQTTWGDHYGGHEDGPEEPVLEIIMEETLAAQIREYLATVAPRTPTDRCDLVALFNAVRRQVLEIGFIDIKSLKDEFGISPTAMHIWVWWLKANIADHLGLPLPPKRPRVVKPKQVEP